MTRTDVFEAIRGAREVKRFSPDEVLAIDEFLDGLAVPRLSSPAGDWLPLALALIKHFEGCRLTAYPDPGTGGVPWTIGYGATRDESGAAIQPGTTWTQERADQRLAADVTKFAAGVDKLLGDAPTTAGQKAALVSFAYNVGTNALADSTLLKMHRSGNYEGAAGQFSRWTKAAGKELPGLVKRRASEARVYQGLSA